MESLTLIRKKIDDAFSRNSLPSSMIFFGPGAQAEKDEFIFDMAYAFLKLKRDLSKEKFISLASSGMIPDLVVFSKGATGSIKVDEIARINDVISFSPFEAENRIFYFREADAMTPQAQNAILKKIEEPYPGNYFFLSVNKKNSLLSTIVSRCVSFYLPEKMEDISSQNSIPPEKFYPFIKELMNVLGEDFVNAERKMAEVEARVFDPERLTSLNSIDKYVAGTIDINGSVTADKEYIKRSVIKMRLAFLSHFLKNKYPDTTERIALFLDNRQFISLDSSVFYNIIGDDIGK